MSEAGTAGKPRQEVIAHGSGPSCGTVPARSLLHRRQPGHRADGQQFPAFHSAVPDAEDQRARVGLLVDRAHQRNLPIHRSLGLILGIVPGAVSSARGYWPVAKPLEGVIYRAPIEHDRGNHLVGQKCLGG